MQSIYVCPGMLFVHIGERTFIVHCSETVFISDLPHVVWLMDLRIQRDRRRFYISRRLRFEHISERL